MITSCGGWLWLLASFGLYWASLVASLGWLLAALGRLLASPGWLLVSLGLLLAFFGRLLVSVGPPFGSSWASFRQLLASLGRILRLLSQ